MPTSKNKVVDRFSKNVDLDGDGIISSDEATTFNSQTNPNDTAKQNYTAVKWGNDHGQICLGNIHQKADVTAGILLQPRDGRHRFFMDNDGQRKGWTSCMSPGNFQVSCGFDNEEPNDSMFLHAENGNILIVATNGKIRLQATDIEMIAVGEGGSKGNIRMNATENVSIDGKKVLVNAKNLYKLVTSGSAELIANSQMKLYSSIIRAVTDGCALKDSKNNLQRIQRANQATGFTDVTSFL